jgi:hypothetical protein
MRQITSQTSDTRAALGTLLRPVTCVVSFPSLPSKRAGDSAIGSHRSFKTFKHQTIAQRETHGRLMLARRLPDDLYYVLH